MLISFAAVLMARTPPQLTSAEPSETFHSTKLTNDIEALKYKYGKNMLRMYREADLMASSGWLVDWLLIQREWNISLGSADVSSQCEP